jgi:hypothetical protein
MATVEIGSDSVLHIPAEMLAGVKPRSKFALDVYGDIIVLRPVEDRKPAWKKPDPAKRVESFLKWANTPRPPAPDIPIEYLDREHIYD